MATIIGLTGGIASGKSTVSNMIRTLGITVIDADVEAKHAVEIGEEAYKNIVHHFGNSILLEDGNLNRSKLGDIIFNNFEDRLKLNEIVHPEVRKRMIVKKTEAIRRGENFIVMDIPLLFESNLENIVDKILLVYVDEDVQLERLMKRNNFTKEEAIVRVKSQMSLQEKKKLADKIINNNGSVEDTYSQLIEVLYMWGFNFEV